MRVEVSNFANQEVRGIAIYIRKEFGQKSKDSDPNALVERAMDWE